MARLSDGQQSLDAAQRAAASFARVGDSRRHANALYFAGFAWYQLRNYDQAEDAYRRALELARKDGDHFGIASNLNGLASVLLRRGDVDGPRRCYAEALVHHAASNHETGRANVLGNFAEFEFNQGNPEQALA